MSLTIVIPAYNEAESVGELVRQIRSASTTLQNVEIIFVDDGSTDRTRREIKKLMADDPRIGLIAFRRNFGKAAALDAGFRMASGDIVITMDADLQDDPAEIPRFLAMLDRGYDVVSGWKKIRHDPLDKTFPSRIFNWMVKQITGLDIHDNNCGFKAYRSECLRNLTLYGEMHRFVPVLLYWRGFRIGEMVVNHRKRRFGKSKYKFSRILKGMFDLLTVFFLTRYISRPLHIFGAVGIIMIALGFMILCYLTIIWVTGQSIGTRPLLFFGFLLMVLGVQTVSTGLLAEFVQRQHITDPLRYFVAESHQPGGFGRWPQRSEAPLAKSEVAAEPAVVRSASDGEVGVVPD